MQIISAGANIHTGCTCGDSEATQQPSRLLPWLLGIEHHTHISYSVRANVPDMRLSGLNCKHCLNKSSASRGALANMSAKGRGRVTGSDSSMVAANGDLANTEGSEQIQS